MHDKSSEINFCHQNQVNQINQSSGTDLQLKPLLTLRVPFCQWIKSLPMEERFLAVKIHIPDIVQLIRRIFSKVDEHSQQRNSTSRSENVNQAKQFAKKHEKNFYQSLIFVSDGHQYLDHICFDFGLLESPDRLFELLMAPGDPISSRPLSEVLKGRRSSKSLNQNLYKFGSREQISYELFIYLRQQIFWNFAQNEANNENITRRLEEQKRRKKQFSSNWKFQPQESKQKILLLGHTDVIFLRDFLAKHQIYVKIYEIQRQIQELLKLQKYEFCNRIFKCKLRKILTPIIDYYEMIYLQWKKQIQKYKKKRGYKYNRNQRDYNSQQKIQIKQNNKYQNKKYKKNRKSNSVESNQTNQTQNSKNKIDKKIYQDSQLYHKEQFIKNQSENNLIHHHQISINPQNDLIYQINQPTKKSISTSTNTSLSSKIQQNIQQQQKRLKIKKQIKIITINKLNQQLQQISDKISQQANQFHDRRVIAFQRIQFLLQYYNIPIKLFGSCASGIAVRNSDIDIAIDSSILMYMDFLPENQKIKASLQKLEELFINQNWITEIKLIKSAAIPLIKLTINTQIPFLDPSIGEMYYQLNRIHKSGAINADITIQTKNKSQQCSHLGIISTNTINNWLRQIYSLHSIIIILKQFLAIKKLNCTYQGGLNTFSLIVLMVAYIFHKKLQNQQNIASVFYSILKFYSQQFNQKQIGIDILNRQNNNIFYIKDIINIQSISKLNKADLEIKDPMNRHKNMTKNCYLFTEIKNLFSSIIIHCFKSRQQEIQNKFKNINILQIQNIQQQIEKQYNYNHNIFIQYLNTIHIQNNL